MLHYLTKYLLRYLLDHGASVSAVNNDGELAIDISESDEMEELLQKEIDKQVYTYVYIGAGLKFKIANILAYSEYSIYI